MKRNLTLALLWILVWAIVIICTANLSAAGLGDPLPVVASPAALATVPDPPPVSPASAPTSVPAPVRVTYELAMREALDRGKPLLVWVGGNFCELCVRDSATEFVHYFTPEFDGVQAPAIVVGVVDSGSLIRAGEVTWWVEGDKEFGHVPSVRGVIRKWLDRREAARRGIAQARAEAKMPLTLSVSAVTTARVVESVQWAQPAASVPFYQTVPTLSYGASYGSAYSSSSCSSGSCSSGSSRGRGIFGLRR